MKSESDFLLGVAVGAGLMYLFDPDRGNRRRALIRDQAVHAGHELEDLGDAAAARARDLGNRAGGAIAETRARLTPDDAGDAVIEARVRSEIGRVVSNPGAVLVSVYEGRATLRGPVLAREVDGLLSAVRSVRGVTSVENLLNVHERPEDIPGLQGAS